MLLKILPLLIFIILSLMIVNDSSAHQMKCLDRKGICFHQRTPNPLFGVPKGARVDRDGYWDKKLTRIDKKVCMRPNEALRLTIRYENTFPIGRDYFTTSLLRPWLADIDGVDKKKRKCERGIFYPDKKEDSICNNFIFLSYTGNEKHKFLVTLPENVASMMVGVKLDFQGTWSGYVYLVNPEHPDNQDGEDQVECEEYSEFKRALPRVLP